MRGKKKEHDEKCSRDQIAKAAIALNGITTIIAKERIHQERKENNILDYDLDRLGDVIN